MSSVKLQDISKIITEKEDVINECLYVSTTNMLKNKQGISTSKILCKSKRANTFKKGDILISNIRPYFKKIWRATCSGFASSDILIFRGNDCVDSDFLYYILSQDSFFEYVMNGSTGTKMPRGDKYHIMNFEIDVLPTLQNQKRIATCLLTLDYQIELNNQINQELENLAQILYNYWFVQFEFPNEDGKPYKSSGGKMIWNENLNQEIPEGWHIKNLGSLISKKRVKIASKENWANEKLIDLANMPSFSMCLNMYELGEKLNTNIFKMDKFDILFGSIRPYLGKAGFAPFDGVLAGTIYSFTTNNDEDYGFILNTVTRKEFFDYAVTRSKGTKMPVIDFDVIEDYTVVIPTNKSLLIRYNEVIMSFIETISNNICCSQELTQLRDDLLPLLMNGQVVISDFDTE